MKGGCGRVDKRETLELSLGGQCRRVPREQRVTNRDGVRSCALWLRYYTHSNLQVFTDAFLLEMPASSSPTYPSPACPAGTRPDLSFALSLPRPLEPISSPNSAVCSRPACPLLLFGSCFSTKEENSEGRRSSSFLRTKTWQG